MNPIRRFWRWFTGVSQREAILEILRSEPRREWYGLEMIKASGGRLGRGTVYVFLHRLEEEGLVTSRPEPESDTSVLGRRLYRALPS
jgi:DNA-binding PadR family transcriptional regulator